MRTQASVMAAIDFFTTEVRTWNGLQTCYTLFAIHHGSRGSLARPEVKR